MVRVGFYVFVGDEVTFEGLGIAVSVVAQFVDVVFLEHSEAFLEFVDFDACVTNWFVLFLLVILGFPVVEIVLNCR